MNELYKIQEENIIWLVSFFIIILVVISNKYEKEYINTNDINKKHISTNITTSVLIIALFIYLYFVIISFKNIDNLKNCCNKQEVIIAFERFITSILFLVAGTYALYVQQKSINNNLDSTIL